MPTERQRQAVLAQRRRQQGKAASRLRAERGEIIFHPPQPPRMESRHQLIVHLEGLPYRTRQERASKLQVRIAIQLQNLYCQLDGNPRGNSRAFIRRLARQVRDNYMKWLALRMAGAKNIGGRLWAEAVRWCNTQPGFVVFITHCLSRSGVPLVRFSQALGRYQKERWPAL